jgi:hypothetical protein
MSGLITGVLVALIGAWATYAYDSREKERTAASAELTTVEKFLPHLTTVASVPEKVAALRLLSRLDPKIATSMAVAYSDESAQAAIAAASLEADESNKAVYDAALAELFRKFYDSRVFRIRTVRSTYLSKFTDYFDKQESCTGFRVSNNEDYLEGYILTAASCVSPNGAVRTDFMIATSSNDEAETEDKAQCLSADKSLDVAKIRPDYLKMKSPVGNSKAYVKPQRNNEHSNDVGVLIGFDAADKLIAITGTRSRRKSSEWSFKNLTASLVGSPIFNTTGEVIAMLVRVNGELRGLSISSALQLLEPVSQSDKIGKIGPGPCDDPIKSIISPITTPAE